MQKCEALRDIYNQSYTPKIINFYKVTEDTLKNRADKLKVYKLISDLSSNQMDYKVA